VGGGHGQRQALGDDVAEHPRPSGALLTQLRFVQTTAVCALLGK